jgi:ppGpp synthetase/RelA/SpoT-type nucleotidyltranferase
MALLAQYPFMERDPSPMAFAIPEYSKRKVDEAGNVLSRANDFSDIQQYEASEILANWRACHLYPINTFQATLRAKLKHGYGPSIVAQRLKRAPSIIAKLQRFDSMALSRMQDIGGLRAVLETVSEVRKLETSYREAGFAHKLKSFKDYIKHPKDDGYRSVHLIFKYKNNRAPEYDGLCLELQLRTYRQHAWATAVETMGTFLGQALKSGRGDTQWRDFFTIASAALATVEQAAPVPRFENINRDDLFSALSIAEQELKVFKRLQGFAVAADHINTVRGRGAYHLITLDSQNRTVHITPYARSSLKQANIDYAAAEERTKAGEHIEAVLVAAGPIKSLRSAYPNYFLDTQLFVEEMQKIIRSAKRQKKNT